MSGFFKAWAAYTGILVKLAPHLLQGELATALSISTMTLYDLLEKYTWEGVKAYHFQFHRKRVASGKSIYQPLEWRQLDSELIASKCFAHSHPTPRAPWATGQKQAVVPFGRSFDLPIRENVFGLDYTNLSIITAGNPFQTFNQITAGLGHQTRGSSGGSPAHLQRCRNWNFRECRSIQCRYQHLCHTCGSNHRAPQCQSGNTSLVPASNTGPTRR